MRLAWLLVLIAVACGGSRDQLLADLQDPRPDIRARAVRKLAGKGDAEDLVLFTRAAKDLSAAVRAEAAGALGQSQDARVVDILGELLEDPDETVQGRAALALSEVKNDKAKTYLTMQYGRRGQHTREVIVQALIKANVPKPMSQVVAAESKILWDRSLVILNEGSLAERVAAAEELGKSGRPEAVKRLLPLLRDSQVVLAAAAARGLADAGDRQAVAPITLLLNENFPELREAASLALMELKDPSSVARLQALAVDRTASSPAAADALLAMPDSPPSSAAACAINLEGAPAEAISAGRLMRMRGGCPVEPVLAKLRSPASLTSGLVAVIGLGPSAKGALALVLPALTAADGSVRALAAEAVSELGDVSANPAVRKAYDSERARMEVLRADWVRKALPRGTAAPATPSKQQALMDKVRAVTAAKARAAGQPSGPSARPPGELIDDASPEQLQAFTALIRALGALHVDGAQALLRSHVEDTSPEVRLAAYVGLSQFGAEGVRAAQQGLFDVTGKALSDLCDALARQGAAGQVALVEALPARNGLVAPALSSLERYGAQDASAPALLSIVQEDGPDAALAASVLARLKAPKLVPALITLLDKPSRPGQREILVALGAQGNRDAAPAIARSLFHDSPEVRVAAAEALQRVGTTSQADALDALRGDYYRSVREAASVAFTTVSSSKN